MNKNFFVTSFRIKIEQPLRRTLQRSVILFIFSCMAVIANAQLLKNKPIFTKSDSLRGSLNENRDWWDVLRYDITVKPDFEKKEIEGRAYIYFKTKINGKKTIQIDLQNPLTIDSAFFNNERINFIKKDLNVWLCELKDIESKQYIDKREGGKGWIAKEQNITFYYHGKPIEARTPPWDGGWIWKKDKNGNPWMSVAVQGLGASAWYPCKDYQGDEPDYGASLTLIVPDSLVAIANGRLSKINNASNNLFSYKWEVKNPINNYCIVPYIGKYVNFTDTLMGEKGKLDLRYWVLDYNLDKAKEQFKQVKPMLRAFEYWFGPYPFYEDSYKLVDAPHLGMEHQSAVAYGNQYKNGYLGSDRSGKTGWGLKWDFIIIHESGHEWFANNITTKDIADMWVHESFTTYSETLFTEYYYGIQAGNEYNYGQRRNIRNDEPIIGPYGVNKEGSGDMYDKGSNMIHSIRHAMNDDKKFREILRGLNKTFWHKTVTTKEIEEYIIKQSGFNFQKVFDQYLRTTQIPILEYYFMEDGKQLYYRYSNCIAGFNLPLFFSAHKNTLKIQPTETWQSVSLKEEQQKLAVPQNLEKLFYIKTKLVTTTE